MTESSEAIHTTHINGFYMRFNTLLSRIGLNLNAIITHMNIPSIGLRRSRTSCSPLDSSPDSTTADESSPEWPPLDSRARIPPPHSHLHRHDRHDRHASHASHSCHSSHSSHYPLLLGSYNWSLRRDNAFITQFNNNNNNLNYREKERNVLSAIMSIVVIATLATALAQPKWFSISGGLCNRKYIGLQEFFYVGSFSDYHLNDLTTNYDNHNRDMKAMAVNPESNAQKETSSPKSHGMVYYGMNGDLKNCVTPDIVTLQRSIIGLCFFAIMFNLIQFFFDTLGVNKKWLNAIRQNAVLNILGVLLCVVIIGVSYIVSNLLEKEQKRLLKQSRHDSAQQSQQSHHIEVKFELSYYLVTLSGLLAIIAAASNLLRRPDHYYIDASDSLWSDDIADANTTPVDDEVSSSTTTSPNWNTNATHLMNLTLPTPQSAAMPPPPPYSP